MLYILTAIKKLASCNTFIVSKLVMSKARSLFSLLLFKVNCQYVNIKTNKRQKQQKEPSLYTVKNI